MFCPECHAEYREGFTRCVDCEVDVVVSLPAEEDDPGESDRLVPLWRGGDPVFYTALTAALNEAEIPFFDNSPRDYLNWLSARQHSSFSYGVPNLDIQVPAGRVDEAREILKELQDAPPAAPEE